MATLLRIATAGSVDDGKSTLIGRLLYDSQLILEDTLAAITKDSRKHGTTGDDIDLALLVDGLEAERQQGGEDAGVHRVAFRGVGADELQQRTRRQVACLAAVFLDRNGAPARQQHPAPQFARDVLVHGHADLAPDEQAAHGWHGSRRRAAALLANGKDGADQVFHGRIRSTRRHAVGAEHSPLASWHSSVGRLLP